MCVAVWFGDERVETVGQLRAFWPNLIRDSRYPDVPPKDGDCLCTINVAATACYSGGQAVPRDDGDWIAFVPYRQLVDLRVACMTAEVAIRDCIRRPMGVEPDTATAALRLISKAIGPPGTGEGRD